MRPSTHKPLGYPVEIYCDESLDRRGYDILGGLWVTRASAIRFRRKAARIRNEESYYCEVKWTKASGSLM